MAQPHASRRRGEDVVDSGPHGRDGDPLHGEISPGHYVGLLAIELETRRRMRVNGRVIGVEPLTIVTDQVYSNCPKYIQARTVAGRRSSSPGTATHTPALRAEDRARIESADTFFVATGSKGEGFGVSHRGGRTGFVKVDGDRLTWPDYSGNMMFNTLGNLALDPRAGLLSVDFERGDLLHLTGRARIDWDAERARRNRGAGRVLDFEVDAVVFQPGAMSLVFGAAEASPFNP